MNVFYIVTRSDQVVQPATLTDPPSYQSAKTFYIVPTLDAAEALASEQIDNVGGTWLIFKLRRIIDPSSVVISPTPVE